MNGRKKILLKCFFVFTVIILLLRPSIIFSSNNFPAILAAPDVRAWGIQKIVKKRPETIRISNIISKENEEVTFKNSSLFFYLYANREWLRNLLFALSSSLSLSIYYFKKRSKLFEISPDNELYLAVSVIRI